MKISLVPTRMDTRLEAVKRGDVLVLNGVEVDLSSARKGRPLIPDGALPWIVGEVTRRGAGLELTLLLPHGADAPDETRFPQDLVVDQDGPVPLPAYATAPLPAMPETGLPSG